jgi:hypothetical protein
MDFTEDVIRKHPGQDMADAQIAHETKCVEQGLPWEASSCSVGQKVLWNPKVHLKIPDVS